MRKSAVLSSRDNGWLVSIISLLTAMPLRSLNPETYHSSAGINPTSSSIGGCSKYEIVRMSAVQLWQMVTASAKDFCAFRGIFGAAEAIASKCMRSAARH